MPADQDKLNHLLRLANTAMGEVHCFTTVRQAPDGYWITFWGRDAYLGETYEVALSTAERGCWFVPERDGPLTLQVKQQLRDYQHQTQEDFDNAWYAENMLECQRLINPARGGEEMARGEMDPGDPLQPADYKTLNSPTRKFNAKIIPLWRVYKKSSLVKSVLGTKKEALLGLYYHDVSTDKWNKVSLSVTPEGWQLQIQPQTVEMAKNLQVEKYVELVVEEGTDQLLNLKVYSDGNVLLLRLITEGGKISFYELDLF